MNADPLVQAICASVDAHSDAYTQASDAIWAHPEMNFHEDYSAAALRARSAASPHYSISRPGREAG